MSTAGVDAVHASERSAARSRLAPAAIDPLTLGVRDQVRDAAARREPLRIVGAGTWLAAGRPVRATRVVSLAGTTGIVEYTPGDLTLTARAGTTLAELDAATARESQWLPFDPFGTPSGTIGATVATASAGPLAHGLGTVRDLVLGLEFVTGTGDVVRGGGRVVKNVAGFDLTRLLTGAWGTLGVITEVTVRLRATPERDETFLVVLAPGGEPLSRQLASIRAARIAPVAAELLNATLARRVGAVDRPALLVRLAANSDSVRDQRQVLGTLGDVERAEGGIWRALRAGEPDDAIVVRFSAAPAALADIWTASLEWMSAFDGALAHATLGRGIVRCIVPSPEHERFRLRMTGHAPAATRIFERLPPSLWGEMAPSAVANRLARGVLDAFDPIRILNPGILGEDGPRDA